MVTRSHHHLVMAWMPARTETWVIWVYVGFCGHSTTGSSSNGLDAWAYLNVLRMFCSGFSVCVQGEVAYGVLYCTLACCCCPCLQDHGLVFISGGLCCSTLTMYMHCSRALPAGRGCSMRTMASTPQMLLLLTLLLL